jgi:hypothetical protein
MAKTYIEKMEEAAGISPTSAGASTRMPYGKGERVPQGGVARPWTGPRPWKGVPLIPRAKGGPVSPGRSKVMRMKGTPLVGFMPLPKKLKKGKKRFPKFPV